MPKKSAPPPPPGWWGALVDWGTHLPQPIEAVSGFLKHFGLKGLVAALLGALFALGVAAFVWKPGQKKEISSAWRFQSKTVFLVYAAKAKVEASRTGKAYVSEDGKVQTILLSDVVEASLQVADALSSAALARLQPRAGDIQPNELEHGDVVILGSPIGNVACNRVIEKLRADNHPLPLDFSPEMWGCSRGNSDSCGSPRYIFKPGTPPIRYDTKYASVADGQQEVQVDHGLFVVGPNPIELGSRLVLIAGCHKLGTWGTTRYLASSLNSRVIDAYLSNAEKNKRYVAGVVRVEAATGTTSLEYIEEF
jgi:hypothetical protein